MKKYILVVVLLMLTGCKVEMDSPGETVEESISIAKKYPNSRYETRSSNEKVESEAPYDFQAIYNQANKQEGFLELVSAIKPGDYFLPSLFIEQKEATYVSGYVDQYSEQGYTIFIIETNDPIEEDIDFFNQIAEKVARTNFGAVTYGSAEGAQAQVPYKDAHQTWVENEYNQETLLVDLGQGLTGYMIANTDNQKLSWNEEKWFIEFSSLFISKEATGVMGKEVVDQLRKISLPEEADKGHFFVSYDGTTNEWFSRVLWTIKEKRYEVNTSKKGTNAVVEMAREMKKIK